MAPRSAAIALLGMPLLGITLLGCGDDGPTRAGTADLPARCGDAVASAVANTGYTETAPAGAAGGSYTPHVPIRIDNVQATPENPVIIEGYEISSDEADCIEVKNSTNVIIRGNYLHDCTWSRDPAEPYSQDEGYAIRVGYAEGVVISDNVLERNKMGLAVHSSSKVLVRRNTITTTLVKSSLRLERVDNAEVTYNYLADNGVPEQFWAPGHRDIGIYLVRSDDIQVHDNVVLRSSSDGISVGGQIDGGGLSTHESDWTGTANRIHIYNNLLLDNMEFGMWLVRARDLSIHHNTIRNGCFTQGPGIGLNFDVDDSEVFANRIVTCLNRTHVELAMSHDNHIHDNVHFSLEDEPYRIRAQDDATNDQIKADWSGIPFMPSSGNLVEDETHLRLGGELRRVMEGNRELSDQARTWQERGWFSCEIEEGVVDDDCVAEQATLGVQGVPSAYLVYEPLMADPVPYAIDPDCR